MTQARPTVLAALLRTGAAALVSLVAACSSAPKAGKSGDASAATSAATAGVASASSAPAAAAPTPEPAPAATPKQPAIRPVETFDAVWTTVRDQHFDKTLNGVDWNAVRDELRPRAVEAASQDELRGVLLEMLSRLGQSHFTVIPAAAAERSPTVATAEEQIAAPAESATAPAVAEALDTSAAVEAPAPSAVLDSPGVSGVDLALVGDELVVLRVAQGSAGAKAGILTGWKFVSVDGRQAGDALRPLRDELAIESDPASPHARQLRVALAVTGDQLLSGRAGETRRVAFEDASGAQQELSLRFEPAALGTTAFGNLPAFPIEVESRIVEIPAAAGKPVKIGVIGFNIWMTGASAALDRAIDSMRGCDGVVIDLRGNPGGVGAMAMGLAGHFLREPASLGSMIGRDNTLEFRASPRKVSSEGKRVRPISKPLAIVQDARSASTSEVFAGGLQDLGRARVFGDASAGMALPAQAIELPSGDVLLHAVADFVTSKGTRLEGRGVIPDEAVAVTREALLEGRDPALDAATAWIAGSTLAARSKKDAPSPTTAPAIEAVVAPTSMPAPPGER
jgi:carboxyl-terminal processing protease